MDENKAVHHILGRTGLLIIAAIVVIVVVGAVIALIYYVTNRPALDNAGISIAPVSQF